MIRPLITAIVISLPFQVSAQANPYYEAGLREGATAKYAGALAYCREKTGDGDDWLQYYLMQFAVKRNTQETYKSLPKKLRDSNSEFLVKNTMGSCEAYLEKEEMFGPKWFIKNAIEPYVKGMCEATDRC